jgi:hypothetical protein
MTIGHKFIIVRIVKKIYIYILVIIVKLDSVGLQLTEVGHFLTYQTKLLKGK